MKKFFEDLNLKELFQSKKFKTLLSSMVLLIGAIIADYVPTKDAVYIGAGLIATYIGGQSMVDYGKNRDTPSEEQKNAIRKEIEIETQKWKK